MLSTHVTTWPSPREMLFVGQKLETYNLLNKCAVSLGYYQPCVFAIPDAELESYAKDIAHGKLDAVMKRSYSGWSNHIITPDTKDPLGVIQEALELQQQWKVANPMFDEPLWICQPYLAQLVHIGEYRSYVVNGAIYYTVATTPTGLIPGEGMEMLGGRLPRPLDSYKCVLLFSCFFFYCLTYTFVRFDPNNPGNPGWLHLDGNDADAVNPTAPYPEQGYEKYLLEMVGKMVLAEEAQYGAISGLRLFGRWDISVCRHRVTGKYQYFVNEITRSWDTCLFHPHADPEGMGDFLLDHLTKLLHHCVTTEFLRSRPQL